ncbi:DNA polymerase III subunits gamma and tau, partial [Lacticaseibacillus paracasei subsp. paracasei CNCM I-2877]
MSYQALYRVWRPQQFKDVIGQEAITKTLKCAD